MPLQLTNFPRLRVRLLRWLNEVFDHQYCQSEQFFLLLVFGMGGTFEFKENFNENTLLNVILKRSMQTSGLLWAPGFRE